MVLAISNAPTVPGPYCLATCIRAGLYPSHCGIIVTPRLWTYQAVRIISTRAPKTAPPANAYIPQWLTPYRSAPIVSKGVTIGTALPKANWFIAFNLVVHNVVSPLTINIGKVVRYNDCVRASFCSPNPEPSIGKITGASNAMTNAIRTRMTKLQPKTLAYSSSPASL